MLVGCASSRGCQAIYSGYAIPGAFKITTASLQNYVCPRRLARFYSICVHSSRSDWLLHVTLLGCHTSIIMHCLVYSLLCIFASYLCMSPSLPTQGSVPDTDGAVFVAPTASVIGDVSLGAGSSVWYGAKVRGDVHTIKIGANSSIGDCSMV